MDSKVMLSGLKFIFQEYSYVVRIAIIGCDTVFYGVEITAGYGRFRIEATPISFLCMYIREGCDLVPDQLLYIYLNRICYDYIESGQ